MRVTILTSEGDVKRTLDGSGWVVTRPERPPAGPSQLRVSRKPALPGKAILLNGVPGRVARKRFAGEPGWGIIRAHGNKQTIQGGNGERPSMEFHGTCGRISALCAG